MPQPEEYATTDESNSHQHLVMDENTLLQHDPATLEPQNLIQVKSALRRLEFQKQQEIYQLRAKSQDVSKVLRASQGNSLPAEKGSRQSISPKPLSPTSTWNLIRAEQKYPDQDARVLVYDPGDRRVTASDLATVIDTWADGGNKWAIFTRLPSRIRDRIDIYVQDDNESAHTDEPYLVQVSTKNKHVQPGFMLYTTIYLKYLGFNNRMRVVLGNIQWLFILRFSNPKRKNLDSDRKGPSNGRLKRAASGQIYAHKGGKKRVQSDAIKPSA